MKFERQGDFPQSEAMIFESHIQAEAARYGMPPVKYIRKVWYHQQAAKLGEYMALTLVDALVDLAAIYVPPSDATESSERS